MYWATAAHEFGHARIRAELPIIGHLRTGAGWAGFVLVAAGVGLAFDRVLYALPRAGELAFGCFALAAGLRIFVLVDEALASVLAYRELRANDAIDFVHLRAIRRALIAAFATYFVTFAAYALLLRYWPLVEALAGDHGAQASELTRLGWTVAAVVSLAETTGDPVRAHKSLHARRPRLARWRQRASFLYASAPRSGVSG